MGNIYTNGLVGRCGYCTMSLVLMVRHNNLLYSYDVQIYVISTSRFCNHIQILCYIYSQNCLFCTFFIRTYVRVWQLRHIIFLHLHNAQLGISITSIKTFCVRKFYIISQDKTLFYDSTSGLCARDLVVGHIKRLVEYSISGSIAVSANGI